jgi:hypothetical protein
MRATIERHHSARTPRFERLIQQNLAGLDVPGEVQTTLSN